MKSSNTVYSASVCLLLIVIGLFATVGADKPASLTKAAPLPPVLDPKMVIPMEQLIAKTRKAHGNIVVQSARLTQLDQRKVNIIDFTDLGGEWHRVVFDAVSGKELEQTPMKDLMPVEKIISRVLTRHKNAKVRSSQRTIQEGNQVVLIDLIDIKNKRWEITADAHTGMTINEFAYELKPEGKQLSLVQIIEKAKELYKGLVILKTRQTTFKQIPARELLALDQGHIRRKLLFNAQSGELLSNTPIIGGYHQF